MCVATRPEPVRSIYVYNSPRRGAERCVLVVGISCRLLETDDVCCCLVLKIALSRYDELHPSEQAHRILAAEITVLMKGKHSKWTTWLN